MEGELSRVGKWKGNCPGWENGREIVQGGKMEGKLSGKMISLRASYMEDFCLERTRSEGSPGRTSLAIMAASALQVLWIMRWFGSNVGS